MLEWLNETISIETLVWLFPISFLLHDFEEIIFVEAWFKKNFEKVEPLIPQMMKGLFQDMSKITSARFSIPVFMQFILYIVACFIAIEGNYFGLFVGLNVVFFLHIFAHIGQSIFLRTYALGVGSAIVITLPYSLYLFYRLLHEQIIQFADLISTIPFGLITGFLVWAGHEIAPKILPNEKLSR